MNIERFERAVEILDALPDEQVNLICWQARENAQERNLPTAQWKFARTREEATCGTIACAAGWIALDPEFQKQGFKPEAFGQPSFRTPNSYTLGYSALSQFFEISVEDAEDIFSYRRRYEDLLGDDFADYAQYMTDRQLWLSRARVYMAEHGECD